MPKVSQQPPRHPTHRNYRKFFRNYGRIEAPLMALTKKDAFSWTPEATKVFEQLKEVM
jgi:hypothetical protein